MSRLITSSFETNSKTSGIEFDNSSIPAAISFVTSPVHGGGYALQIATSSQASFFIYNPFSSNQTTGVYLRVWIQVISTPNVDTKIAALFNSSTAQRSAIILTTGLQLQLVNSSNTQVGSNSATLSTNTWYCLEMYCDASVSNGTITARLGGEVFASGAGNSSSGWSSYRIGLLTSGTGTILFDDVAVNDNQGTAQNSWPGVSFITRMTPSGAGDSNAFSVQVGGTAGSTNNYTRVNEVTPNGATSYNGDAVVSDADMFTVTAASSIPSDAYINCVVVGGQYANLTLADSTTAFKFQAEKSTGSTKSQSAAIIPNSTSYVVNTSGSASTYPLIMYNDPTGSPWSSATVASMQIGYITTAVGVNAAAISTVWALVDYSLAATVNTSETITTSENRSVSEVSIVSLSDSISLSENVVLDATGQFSRSDTITTNESVQISIVNDIRLSDSISTNENVVANNPIGVSVSELLSITELPSVLAGTTTISISDSMTISENINMRVISNIEVNDAVIYTEEIETDSVFAPLQISITESTSRIPGVKIV